MVYVLLKDAQGFMIVRTVEYWENYIQNKEHHSWVYVTNHVSSSALLKMIEIATDNLPDDERKRRAMADNTPEHVNKKTVIHWRQT